MVDFDNETTITRPAADIERVLILQKREDFLNAFEQYSKQNRRNVQVETHVLGSRIEALFMQIEAMLRDHLKPEEFIALHEKVKSEEPEELIQSFFTISGLLRDIHLTKIDTMKKPPLHIVARNKMAGQD